MQSTNPLPVQSHCLLDQLQDGTIAADRLLDLLRRYRLMPKLLQEVVIDDAIAPQPCDRAEIFEAYRQFYTQYNIKSDEQFQAWLDRNRTDRDQIEAMITRNLKLEKFKQERWGHQLESYFLKRKRFLDRVIYSLIRVDSPTIARELYFRLQAGEASFSDLAKRYSKGHESQTNGVLGPVEMNQPHPALAEILATHAPGELIPPIHIEDWVILARVEQFFPAQLDDAMRQRLLHELFEEWLDTQLATL
jgi:parvulin-like peptidyl-prolyl isomerase